MLRTALSCLLGSISLAAETCGQLQDRPRSGLFQSGTSIQRPNAKLPAHIAAQIDGEGVSLIPDPEKAGDQGIPIYLVNHSPTAHSFDSQDNDLYIKLETRRPGEGWRRAQAHIASTCGNSYYPLKVDPGQHRTLFGYQPPVGREATVRFAMHSPPSLVSRSFLARVSDQDIADARVDTLSLRGVPPTIMEPLWRLPSGLIPLLESGDIADLLAALSLWKQFGEIPRLSVLAEQLTTRLAELPKDDPGTSNAIEQIERALEQPFHPQASPERLREYCLDYLKSHEAPAASAPLYWATLNLPLSTRQVPAEERKEIYLLAARHMIPAPFHDAEQVDELFSTTELWALLDQSGQSRFRHPFWAALIRRQLETQVVAKLKTDRPADRRDVLRLLLNVRRDGLPRRPGKDEQAMWLEEFEADPVVVAATLNRYLDRTEANRPAFARLAAPARQFWIGQTKRSSASEVDFPLDGRSHDWEEALGFFRIIHPEFDEATWQRLSQFRGYHISSFQRLDDSGWAEIVEHQYAVRKAAKKTLRECGREIEITLPDKVFISESPQEEP